MAYNLLRRDSDAANIEFPGHVCHDAGDFRQQVKMLVTVKMRDF